MRELPELATLQQLHQPKQWMETSWWRGELAVLPLEVVFRLSQGRHRKEVVVVCFFAHAPFTLLFLLGSQEQAAN